MRYLGIRFRRFIRNVRNFLSRDGYRPERHYMRGPGPKTRAKMATGNEHSHQAGNI
jgi:hypothetical protein